MSNKNITKKIKQKNTQVNFINNKKRKRSNSKEAKEKDEK